MNVDIEERQVPAVTKIFEDGFAKGLMQGEYNALAKLQYLLAKTTIDDVANHINGRVTELTKNWTQ